MKKLKITLLALFISVVAMAQSGIVFQGIARDNSAAAIKDKTMTFTFRITKTDGTDLYKETQQIKTDNFGLFSHIIGTGNALTGSFGALDFTQTNLKAIISVDNSGTDTQIYDQKFEYVPYAKRATSAKNAEQAQHAERATSAKNADDGVPIGTVVTFLGVTAPKGWVLCHGQAITDAKYAKLRAVLGNSNKVPDLRGRFLKGAGVSSNIPLTQYDEEIHVRVYQNQSIMRHTHHFDRTFTTTRNGAHSHKYTDPRKGDYIGLRHDSNGSSAEYPSINGGTTTSSGDHTHSVHVKGDTHQSGTEENRPWSYTVNYIIKY